MGRGGAAGGSGGERCARFAVGERFAEEASSVWGGGHLCTTGAPLAGGEGPMGRGAPGLARVRPPRQGRRRFRPGVRALRAASAPGALGQRGSVPAHALRLACLGSVPGLAWPGCLCLPPTLLPAVQLSPDSAWFPLSPVAPRTICLPASSHFFGVTRVPALCSLHVGFSPRRFPLRDRAAPFPPPDPCLCPSRPLLSVLPLVRPLGRLHHCSVGPSLGRA